MAVPITIRRSEEILRDLEAQKNNSVLLYQTLQRTKWMENQIQYLREKQVSHEEQIEALKLSNELLRSEIYSKDKQ